MDNVVSRSERPAAEFFDKLYSGSPDKAIEIATQQLAKSPESAAVLRSLARLHEALGSSAEAATLWSRLYSLAPGDLEAVYHEARARIAAGLSPAEVLDQLCERREALRTLLHKLLAPDDRFVPDPAVRHIAIGGVSFSGSTLMDRILGGLPGVRSIGESHWLTNAMNINGRGAAPIDFADPESFASAGVIHCTVCWDACKILTHEFRAGLAADRTDWYFRIARQLGTQVLVSADKNPPKLVENDPLLQMDLLVLFKSPEQAWASHLAKLPKNQKEFFYIDELRKYIKRWNRTYSTFLYGMQPRGKKLFISFDDFVAAPSKILQSLCRSLDLEFDPSVLVRTTPGHAIGGNGRAVDRLRQSEYAVEILPLPAPNITKRQRHIIAHNDRMQALYAELKSRFSELLQDGEASDSCPRSIRTKARSRYRDGTVEPPLGAIRAALAFRQSDPHRAAALLGALVEKFPKSPKTHAYLGRVLVQLEDYAAALGVWDNAMRLAPNNREALTGLAETHLALKNWEQAAAYANRVLAIGPDDEPAQHIGLDDEPAQHIGPDDEPAQHIGLDDEPAQRIVDRTSAKLRVALVDVVRRWGERLRRVPAKLRTEVFHFSSGGARSSGALGRAGAAAAMVQEMARASRGEPRAISRVSSLLSRRGPAETGHAAWQSAKGDIPLADKLMRALEHAGDESGVLEHFAATLQLIKPFDTLDARETDLVAGMFRRCARHLRTAGRAEYLDNVEATVLARNPPGAFLQWTLAEIAACRGRRADALAYLDNAMAFSPPPTNGAVILRAERAVLLANYYLFGEALAEIGKMGDQAIPPRGFYRRRLATLFAVSKLCPTATEPLRYPECLIDVILEEAARQPIRYEPRARHVAIFSGSLAQGGDEKQMVTAAAKLSQDPRIENLALVVRSVHLRPGDSFFQPLLAGLRIDFQVYGRDWHKKSILKDTLPELADRSRLLSAISLLPSTLREDFVRVCRALLDGRYAVAHVWQDLQGAVLAAGFIGVPIHFVHRGSLSPNHWMQNEIQQETHFRPMRHIYRRLLENPRFFVVNNSEAGSRSDSEWLDWKNPDQFRVLPNMVDFASVGTDDGKNIELRRKLGIPDRSPLVGGAFRIAQVKRPQIWIRAARLVADAHPDAHFLIIGDGDLSQFVRDAAEKFGIANRIHLPGRVSNVSDWYRTMDLSLLTSEREGIPNALIEAQYFGVPVVASDVGGVREAIEPGVTGFLVAGDSPSAYAEKVIEALQDEQWRAAAADQARAFVRKKFDLPIVLDKLVGYYGLGSASGT